MLVWAKANGSVRFGEWKTVQSVRMLAIIKYGFILKVHQPSRRTERESERVSEAHSVSEENLSLIRFYDDVFCFAMQQQ